MVENEEVGRRKEGDQDPHDLRLARNCHSSACGAILARWVAGSPETLPEKNGYLDESEGARDRRMTEDGWASWR